MFLIRRNNNRAPDQFVTIATNPVKALKNLEDMSIKLLDLLGDYVHRFIPEKSFSKGESPEVGDIVLFVIKEAEGTRNGKYRYGKVVQTAVGGRVNKVKVTYKNPSKTSCGRLTGMSRILFLFKDLMKLTSIPLFSCQSTEELSLVL